MYDNHPAYFSSATQEKKKDSLKRFKMITVN